MEEIKNILIKHSKQYPVFNIEDALKLIYQNEFGCEHLVEDKNFSLNFITKEFENISDKDNLNLYEDIGNKRVRLNLKNIRYKSHLVALNEIFILSSKTQNKGNIENFEKKIEILKLLTKNNMFSFSIDNLNHFLNKYKADGYLAISHSKEYKKEYTPAYRVIEKCYIPIFDILSDIENLSSTKNIIIAIDGNAAAGKSTLGQILKATLNANLFHTDDFFLPKELRTPERLNEIGGNIHYEMLKILLDNIKRNKEFKYKPFNCTNMEYDKEISVYPNKINIIEGSYSMKNYFGNIYDLKIFMKSDYETQKKRIINRNGYASWINFKSKWIPAENKYFNKENTLSKADYIIEIK